MPSKKVLYSTLIGMDVVDGNGRRVGRIEDIIAADRGGQLHVIALSIGPRALLHRLGLRKRPAKRIGWEHVEDCDGQIRLVTLPDHRQPEQAG